MAKIRKRKLKYQPPKLSSIDTDIVEFWNKYYHADCLERRKIVEKLPFDTKADKDLANSFFEDIFFAVKYIK